MVSEPETRPCSVCGVDVPIRRPRYVERATGKTLCCRDAGRIIRERTGLVYLPGKMVTLPGGTR
jgi:hypothetical protein